MKAKQRPTASSRTNMYASALKLGFTPDEWKSTGNLTQLDLLEEQEDKSKLNPKNTTQEQKHNSITSLNLAIKVQTKRNVVTVATSAPLD